MTFNESGLVNILMDVEMNLIHFVLLHKDLCCERGLRQQQAFTNLGLVSLYETESGWVLCFSGVTVMPGQGKLKGKP